MKKILSISFILIMSIGLIACEKTKNTVTSSAENEKVSQKTDNKISFSGIPSWAKDLGAIEPEGLKVIPGTFESSENDTTKKHSFKIKYTGQTKKLFSEAKRMTKEMEAKIDWEDETEFLGSGKLLDNHIITISVKTDTKNKYVDEPFLYYEISGK